MAQEVAITPVLGTNAFGTGCGQDLWRFVLPGVWKTGDPRFNVLGAKDDVPDEDAPSSNERNTFSTG